MIFKYYFAVLLIGFFLVNVNCQFQQQPNQFNRQYPEQPTFNVGQEAARVAGRSFEEGVLRALNPDNTYRNDYIDERPVYVVNNRPEYRREQRPILVPEYSVNTPYNGYNVQRVPNENIRVRGPIVTRY